MEDDRVLDFDPNEISFPAHFYLYPSQRKPTLMTRGTYESFLSKKPASWTVALSKSKAEAKALEKRRRYASEFDVSRLIFPKYFLVDGNVVLVRGKELLEALTRHGREVSLDVTRGVASSDIPAPTSPRRLEASSSSWKSFAPPPPQNPALTFANGPGDQGPPPKAVVSFSRLGSPTMAPLRSFDRNRFVNGVNGDGNCFFNSICGAATIAVLKKKVPLDMNDNAFLLQIFELNGRDRVVMLRTLLVEGLRNIEVDADVWEHTVNFFLRENRVRGVSRMSDEEKKNLYLDLLMRDGIAVGKMGTWENATYAGSELERRVLCERLGVHMVVVQDFPRDDPSSEDRFKIMVEKCWKQDAPEIFLLFKQSGLHYEYLNERGIDFVKRSLNESAIEKTRREASS